MEECGPLSTPPPAAPAVLPDPTTPPHHRLPANDGPYGPPSHNSASETGHHILHWGKAEWCAQCGRVTEASPAGRAQQWRRLCQPLPSYIAKLQKGHRLVYIGHWKCLPCTCPTERLYRTRCVSVKEPQGPSALFHGDPQAPPDLPSTRGSLCVRRSHVVRDDGMGQGTTTRSSARGTAQGASSTGQANVIRVSRAPIQSQLARFFPDAKRPRLMPAGQLLHTGTNRHLSGPAVPSSAQGTAQGEVGSGQATQFCAEETHPVTPRLPDAKRRRCLPVGHSSLSQASGRPPG